ncbi:hypothetical protein Acy02nite_57760 [Actinoplanes cyaneus]|uniref:Uncharacterized protein n=1 Tax=Actinoplanes cyaneus TaxID=52696 RepID=A0A919M338_9ACTN|nr:2Fe-2S iron-sulfur cluster-binding protein [Actinoplanes cyaneus]MCW2139816.1 Ferredoxin-NADP reductase [Actinoplanes cyaneus]GID67895.1 hypothetical protein Acy02nite_57760 [Actinoplanes cyaneus]
MTSEYVARLRRLTAVGQVEAIIGRPGALINLKQRDRLDDGGATVLAHSPIAGFGYRDARGDRRATFVGGTPGFVRVHTPRRISLAAPADEPGPISGGVSFVFLLPGVGETLRLNGSVTGQDRSRIQVEIQEAYVHCPRCILRSRLWEQPRSASSAPGSTRLEVTVKRVEGGVFSTHAHDTLRVGDRLSVRGPSGNLRVSGEVVMVAAGSGITPMMSILRSGLDGALLYGNRDETSILFADELDRLQRSRPGLSVTHRLTRPGPAWTGQRGRLDTEAVRTWLDEVAASPAAQYVLCGPDPVMRTVHDVLAERGVPDDRIHQESYTSAVVAPVAGTGPHLMTVEDGGHEVAAVTVTPGETLLAAGAPMPYSCTVGNCGECVVRLRAGDVTMSSPNCLTPEQRAAGFVLTCVTQPTSAVTVDVADSY